MIAAELAARVDFARRLAREAGALAKRYFLREIAFEAQTKGPQDWVSAADLAVEELIRRRLAERVSRRHRLRRGRRRRARHARVAGRPDRWHAQFRARRALLVCVDRFRRRRRAPHRRRLRSFARRALLGGQRRRRMERCHAHPRRAARPAGLRAGVRRLRTAPLAGRAPESSSACCTKPAPR